MPTHESEAIVLRQYSFSDADRIIVFATREFGKIRAVGQGLKKIKSRLAGSLEPMNHVRLMFWTREGVDLCRIRNCETLHSYLGRQASLEKFFAFNYFAEVIEVFVEDNNPNIALFRLLLAVLSAGESKGIQEELIHYFEIWTLRLGGLLPDYGYCSGCRKCVKESGFYASPSTGQGHCGDCAPAGGVFVDARDGARLQSILALPPERYVAQSDLKGKASGLGRLSRMLMDLHLERPMKSYEPLRKILRGS